MNTILSLGMPVSEAGITALLGYLVVFFGLVLLMLVVTLVGKLFTAAEAKKTAAPEEIPVEAPKTEAPTAPGAAGEVKLHDVEPKVAAMLMAIVAHKMQKPINELRFISVKEVK